MGGGGEMAAGVQAAVEVEPEVRVVWDSLGGGEWGGEE